MINVDDLISGAFAAGAAAPSSPTRYSALDREAALTYWRLGLRQRGTRFDATQQIVRGILRYPQEFGFTHPPKDEEIGAAVAAWLARSGHNSADWTADPSISKWATDAAYWAERLRESESKVHRGRQTQLSTSEVDMILAASANGLDLSREADKRVRLQRELVAFGLINKAKYARLKHGQGLGKKCEVRLGAKSVLAKLPGSSGETYKNHLRWMEAAGIIESRDRSYSKARKLAKLITLDLDPTTTVTEAEMQLMFDVHRQTKYDMARIAHGLQLIERYSEQELNERYGRAHPASLIKIVQAAKAGIGPVASSSYACVAGA